MSNLDEWTRLGKEGLDEISSFLINSENYPYILNKSNLIETIESDVTDLFYLKEEDNYQGIYSVLRTKDRFVLKERYSEGRTGEQAYKNLSNLSSKDKTIDLLNKQEGLSNGWEYTGESIYMHLEDLKNDYSDACDRAKDKIEGIANLMEEWWLSPDNSISYVKTMISNQNSVNAVYSKEGEVIGFGHAAYEGNHGFIFNLYVKKSYRGRGLGTLIMESLLARLKDLKIEDIVLCVNSDNQPAIALYEKLGFVKEKSIYSFNPG